MIKKTQQREWFSVKNVPEDEHNFVINESIKNDCLLIIKYIKKEDINNFFSTPVDLVRFPNYLAYIETPMDLGLLQKNLENNVYKETTDFSDDCRQIWMNCEIFNNPGDVFSNAAKACSKAFEQIWSNLLKKLDNLVRIEQDNYYGFDKMLEKNFLKAPITPNTNGINGHASSNKSNYLNNLNSHRNESSSQSQRMTDKEKIESERKAELEREKLRKSLGMCTKSVSVSSAQERSKNEGRPKPPSSVTPDSAKVLKTQDRPERKKDDTFTADHHSRQNEKSDEPKTKITNAAFDESVQRESNRDTSETDESD